jgi:outer membrane immunogenic protein
VRSCVALMLLSALGSGPVLAADFPLPAGEPARLPVSYDANGPYTNWAGAYLGLNGGYGLGSSQWTLGLLGTDVFNTSGFLFGGTAGFNFPISAVLVGLEGDIDWSGLSGNATNCAVNASGAAAACQTKSNLLGTARARVGYAFDRTLIYVRGGTAFAPVQTGLSPPSTFDVATKFGWTAGASSSHFSGTGAPRPITSLSISPRPPARPRRIAAVLPARRSHSPRMWYAAASTTDFPGECRGGS